MTLSPPAHHERLESEKEMEAFPGAMDLPPGAVAFCEIQPRRKNIDMLLKWNKRGGGGSICTHTLWTMGFSKNRLSRDKEQSLESNILSDHVGM